MTGATQYSPAADGGRPRRGGRRAACMLVLAAALAGLALGRLAGLWIAFDLFNHFVWHLGVVAAAAAIGSMLPRWGIRSTVGLSLAGFLGISAWALAAGGAGETALPLRAGERAIRVMTFNTWLSNHDWRAVAAEIERAAPDVAVLMELGPEKTMVLDALAASYPHRVDCLDISYCNLAIVSKFAFVSSGARTRWLGPPYIEARFGEELGGLAVFGVHTIRPPHFRSQLQQMRAIAAVVAATPGPRLAAGDFNATPMSHMLQAFTSASGLTRLTRLPSWPASFGPFPQIAIDHIFVSGEFRLLAGPAIGRSAGSDHYPVIATLAIGGVTTQ